MAWPTTSRPAKDESLNRRLEMSAVRADGTEFPVELTVTRIPVDGPPLFTAYPARHHRAQAGGGDRCDSVAADLSEADRRKNEFLAMLAHELRNPLAPIRNAVQVAAADRRRRRRGAERRPR